MLKPTGQGEDWWGKKEKGTNSRDFVKTVLCSNHTEAQCWGGFSLHVAVIYYPVESHRRVGTMRAQHSTSKHSAKKKKGFLLADEIKGRLLQVFTLCPGYTNFKTITKLHILFIKVSLSSRTLWSWKISSNVCFLKRLESRTLVSFCLSVLLRVLF